MVDRQRVAVPVNEGAQGLVVPDSDGRLVTRGLRHLEGPLLEEDEMPDVRALRGEEVRGELLELDRPDEEGGGKIYYSVRASPLIRAGETEPSHALLLYHDSTAEYENMRKLQLAHEARYLFEHAPQGVATLDDAGMILQANQAFGALVGAAPAELAGHRLGEFDADGDLVREIRSAVERPDTLVQVDRSFTARPRRTSRRRCWR